MKKNITAGILVFIICASFIFMTSCVPGNGGASAVSTTKQTTVEQKSDSNTKEAATTNANAGNNTDAVASPTPRR